MTPLPVWAHELVAAPLAALLALLLLEAAFGLRRAAVEFLALVAYGYALEAVAIRVFASHSYGDTWRVAPGGVPLGDGAGSAFSASESCCFKRSSCSVVSCGCQSSF